MKMLVVSNMFPDAASPGYGVFVKNFCEQLETLGVSYDLAVMRKKSGKLQKVLAYVAFYGKSFFRSLLGRYDVVYVHYASHSSPGVLLARKLRKFCIFTNCHGSDVIPQNGKQERMQKNTRAILACSQKVVVPSEFFKRVVCEKYGLDDQKVYVCASGGVREDAFFPLRAVEQNEVFTIGFASRIIRGKGWDVLLRACASLPNRDFRLVIVGDGPQKDEMLARIKEYRLEANVQLSDLLPQEQLGDVYRMADAFVFPTELAESLGLVAIEAMACGTPVIASDYAAPADYVVDGVNGYKFPKSDAEALAQRLLQLRSLSAQDRAALRKGALETAQAYTRDAVTQTLKTIVME